MLVKTSIFFDKYSIRKLRNQFHNASFLFLLFAGKEFLLKF